jgi:hypothetical protein
MEEWENKKQEDPKEAPHTPGRGWGEIVERMSNIEIESLAIDDNMCNFPETDERRIAWEKVARKIIELRETIRDDHELEIEPQQELFDSIGEVEKDMKKFII